MAEQPFNTVDALREEYDLKEGDEVELPVLTRDDVFIILKFDEENEQMGVTLFNLSPADAAQALVDVAMQIGY